MKITVKSCLLLSAALCLPTMAHAQGASKDAPIAERDTLDPQDIIVTASRRAERVQDTAIAVNAFGSEQLEAAGLTDTSALQRAAPSLQFATSAGSSFVYLRGIGSNIFGSFSDNSVATYVDGVYVPRQTAAVQELFDIDRVEVLRGPQATLYGRNATGGAIMIATAAPSDSFTASGDVEYGNYDTLRVRAMVSGPIAGDALKARIAVIRHRRDGYSTNLATGADYDDKDLWAVRGTLLAEPTDNLSITLSGNWSKESGAPGASKSVDPNSLPFRTPPFGAGTPFSPDPRASYRSLVDSNPQENYGANLRVNWDLGPAELVSNSAFNRYEIGPNFLDLDDSLAPLLEYRGETSVTKFYYQDLSLTSERGSRLGWLFGATLLHQKTGGELPTLTPGGLSLTRTNTEVDAFAVYGQLDFNITDTLRAVGGLRYSKETRDGIASQSFAGSPFFTQTNKKSWDDVSPKIGLEYRPNPDTLVYLSATKGFKSGSFDPINVSNSADPEIIWSYEAGVKAELFDRLLMLNLTAFHYDYKDLQIFSGVVNGSLVQTFIENAGKANVNGLEFEPTLRFSKDFRMGGSLTLLDGQYASGTILADLANARPGAPGFPATVNYFDVGGNRMIQSPKVTTTLYADWTIPLANGGSIQLYGDYFYQSRRFFSAFEDPTLSAKGYEVVNLRATFNFPGDRFYVSGYIRNAGNTLIRSQISRTPPFGTLESYAAPRLYGAQVGVRF